MIAVSFLLVHCILRMSMNYSSAKMKSRHHLKVPMPSIPTRGSLGWATRLDPLIGPPSGYACKDPIEVIHTWNQSLLFLPRNLPRSLPKHSLRQYHYDRLSLPLQQHHPDRQICHRILSWHPHQRYPHLIIRIIFISTLPSSMKSVAKTMRPVRSPALIMCLVLALIPPQRQNLARTLNMSARSLKRRTHHS